MPTGIKHSGPWRCTPASDEGSSWRSAGRRSTCRRTLITVARSWDVKAGPIEPKSHAGKRTVPIAAVLREHLIGYQLRSGRRDGLVFGVSGIRPFTPTAVRRRALTAWKAENRRRRKVGQPGLEAIGLHECRVITLDRYGHLMPVNEEEAAGLLDGYLARAVAGVE